MIKLFSKENVVGIFKGFNEGGLEFHADIVLKYDNRFQNIPMHGQFLIVELEGENEAVLGRITSVAAMGKFSGPAGEDYAIRAMSEGYKIAEDLRETYLKYKIDVRVLGVIRVNDREILFAPSHRRLPHVGSRVAFLSDELLQEVAGHTLIDESGEPAPPFGHLAFGEFVYTAGKKDAQVRMEPWMTAKSPEVISRFRVDQLVSRRSFVFARAGYGKSNLVKLLFSSLYAKDPFVLKRDKRQVPVGTIIFDPDGEYFWPDDSGRPGLCDVPHLEEKIVVFTNRQVKSPFYQSFVSDSIKLDIRRLRPADVISIALPPEKQSQQNVQKLKGLPGNRWVRLVDLINKLGNTTPLEDVRELILGEENRDSDRQDAEIIAIRSNMTTIIRLIHDPSSQMLDKLFESLHSGKLCVVDISQMRGANGLILTGLILQQIFEHNQNEFTQSDPNSIPTIAVLEEAQSVLGGNGGTDSPYLAWVKEGRKFGLGTMLITQQPGSISDEILSQGDNWFIFHLLSAVDLTVLRKANAHFSNDLLSSLLNEPIPGNGIFWSSTGGKPYPVSVRVLSFENIYSLRDPQYNLPPGKTFGAWQKQKYDALLAEAKKEVGDIEIEALKEDSSDETVPQTDTLEIYIQKAFAVVKANQTIMGKLERNEAHWMLVQGAIRDALPASLLDRNDVAYRMVPRFLSENFKSRKFKSVKRPSSTNPGNMISYIEFADPNE
jgi:DNA helicase HerA-like ATPase